MNNTSTSSRQVSWWSVHEYVAPTLATVETWPMIGTPEWCALDNCDPAKIAAVFDAAQHWALRVETNQVALAEASKAISAACDWPTITNEIKRRNDLLNKQPWMKRVVDVKR